MNLNLKTILVLALFALSSFPVVILCVLLATGRARIEFGSRALKPGSTQVEVLKRPAIMDSLGEENSKTLQGAERERSDISLEKQELSEKQQALDLLERDLESKKTELDQKRTAMESLMAKNDSLTGKKMRRLSKVYASMRPADAAQIIGTLPDETAESLLSGINDDRQKAKIFAALSPEKASELTRFMAGLHRVKGDSSAL
jgi:flagellar motility protein MotE (MotC chaperone)